jgi:hypothetical protein
VIDNRIGAGGNIGTKVVAPDGRTLLTVASSHAINATLYDSSISIESGIGTPTHAKTTPGRIVIAPPHFPRAYGSLGG